METHLWFWIVAFLILGAAHGVGEKRGALGEGLEPWASNTHPTDVAKRHVEEITAARREYTITQGGAMDGQNCRSPIGVWHAWKQTWESNRRVRMENVGETDVVSPWLANGRNNFRTLEEIVASAVEPGMTDAEKAIAIWYQETTHRTHHATGDQEDNDPVKVFNVYGHNTCGDDSMCMAGLWRVAGLKVRPAHLLLHCVSQVYYDGGWHLMDGDMHTIYLKRDNKTIASEQELARDHDLIKRTRVHGLLAPDSHNAAELEAAQYVYEGEPTGKRDCIKGHTMNMVLRPGEAIVWRWGHLDPLKYHGKTHIKRQVKSDDWKGKICNGLWEYRPDLSKGLWRRGAETVKNIRAAADGLAAEAGKTGVIIWKMQSPYPFIGGRYEVKGRGAKIALSLDGKKWRNMTTGILDYQFPSAWGPWYEYRLRCRLEGDARLKAIAIINDVQMAPLALPGMVVGKNRFVYTDDSPGPRKIRITHEWVERSASKPPKAPAKPIFPPEGGETNGTDVVFKWPASEDADGDKIADYHFELSDRPDMKWPLSPNFAKLISMTADRGKAQYTLPYPGLLTPDTKYYWRVRAQDDKGVWGAWSRTWSFTARGVAYPVDVTLELDKDLNIGTLRWKPNPVGRRPVKYRVYGSDEKGFSVSDKPYKVNVGAQKGKLPDLFPANFVAETEQPELVVVGVGIELPNANKAYYRVVAVDNDGKRSWSSDYVAAPRPFIYTKPVLTAEVGKEYRCQVSSIRSIGDLRVRGGKKGFWDVEEPKFTLKQGPAWLKIDETTGVLSGAPNAAGKAEVIVTAAIDREVLKLDIGALSWGQEKVVETSMERVGSATQQFVIDVGR